MADAHKNFAYSTVATAPSPASSGTSLVVASGEGTRFPAVPFNATVWPSTGVATPANAEIVRVTAISTDTFTIARAQESSSARSITTGDRIIASITAKTLTDVEAGLGAVAPLTSKTYTLSGDVAMTSADTYYDGPSGTFDAGIWAIDYKVSITQAGSLSQAYKLKLWDGTTSYDEVELDSANAGTGSIMTVGGFAIVTLTSTTTLKASAASSRASNTMSRDFAYQSASTHTASRLSGVKIDQATGYGVSQQYLGYNTVGASFENMNAGRAYCKSVTLSSDGLLTSIGAHVKGNATNVGGFGVAIYDDNAGTVGKLIAYVPDAITTLYMNTTARWVEVPVGKWLTAGTYWIAANSFNTTDASCQIAYDGSGADKYVDSDNLWVSDGSLYTINSTSNRYSLRANIVATSLSGTEKSIIQTSHGFAAGDVLRYTGSVYAKAKADADATADVVGIVRQVPNTDSFILHTLGWLNNLSGLTAGSVYYLSTSTAGALTATEPTTTGHIHKPLLVADSTTSGYFTNWRGMVITDINDPAQVEQDITQTSHGFAAGDVLRHNGTIFTKAQADSAANAEVVGIVTEVLSSSSFRMLLSGYVTGLSGLTAGTTYFLSSDTAGAITATEPTSTGQVSKPLVVATSTTTGYFVNWRGITLTEQSGASDPVTATLGTATSAYEFNTSSLTGLTALGSPSTENANTTISGNYYIRMAANASVNWCGRYVAATTPFTAVAKVSAFAGYGAFNACGIFIAASTPGGMHVLGPRFTSTGVPALQLSSWTGPTGSGSDLGAGLGNVGGAIPMWVAVVANDSDNCDFYYSYNGYLWSRWVADSNPSYTVGAVGITANAENGTTAAVAAFDYLRVWNSALTLLGSG